MLPALLAASSLFTSNSANDKAKAASAAAWANRGDPYAGAPDLPTDHLADAKNAFAGITDATAGVTPDRSGLNAYAKEAMRTGPSAWSQLALQQNQQKRDTALNQGMAQAQAQGQQARDNMAMQGGLTGGAAERMNQSTARSVFDMGQDVNRQSNDNAMQIGINDEQNRIAQLGQLPGMQNQAAGFDLSKAGQQNAFSMGQAGGSNAFDLSKGQEQNAFDAQNYATQAGIWGAGKQADMEDPNNPASPNYDDGSRWYKSGGKLNPFNW